MMEQKEFIQIYKKDRNVYEQWGNYVKQKIVQSLEKKVDIHSFLKLNVSVRVKSVDSLLEKAFLRNKEYNDPYNEITDKVGMRFVVLYLDEVYFIGKIIEDIDEWNASKDRDFSDEIEKHPEKFDYESLHYVVTNKQLIEYKGLRIPKGTPCEIQIRTLLQHAYCEMSHNTIYKKNVHSKVKRFTSRSMALIESADYFFKEVKGMVHEEEKIYNNLLPNLIEYYSDFAKLTIENKINMLIIDNYREFLTKNIFDEIKNYIEKNKFLKDVIVRNYEIKLIYRQPVVLLLYYLISKARYKVAEEWPLTDDELIPLYNDLGYSLDI
ncbi:RelA/SpoT domain-containing protein (plasmid) [Clostridium botulinum C/D str. BKT12695]|nr:RelA/SpoT domain-containing protein [Clostridium botulinum C/D str. BKT12695]